MTLFAAVVVAAPARAGGPLQPPDGPFAGFTTHYRIPPVSLDNISNPGRCLRWSCWSLGPEGHGEVTAGIELWDSGTDPNRAPTHQVSFYLYSATYISSGSVCITGTSQPVVGRIVAEPVKKLKLECTAEVVDRDTAQPLATLPLLGPSTK
jgi:hypothetical protein